MIPAPWSFEYDPCKGKDPFTGETYGRDFPITGNVPGSSLDGDGDYKPCFCRVKFAPSIPLAEQHDLARLMTAAPDLLKACRQSIITLDPMDKDHAELYRLLRAAIDKATGEGTATPEPKPAKLITAAPVMFEALREIAARGPVPGHETAGALLLRLVGSQATARQALEAAKPDNATP